MTRLTSSNGVVVLASHVKSIVLRAEVAELADAQDLGSCGVKPVKVQILSSAP